MLAIAVSVLAAAAIGALVFERRRREHYHGQALLWRAAAINTAAEWVRQEKGEVASQDFVTWANNRSDTLLRDHLPAIASAHSARWPNFRGTA